jgi:hypothetical protein
MLASQIHKPDPQARSTNPIRSLDLLVGSSIHLAYLFKNDLCPATKA